MADYTTPITWRGWFDLMKFIIVHLSFGSIAPYELAPLPGAHLHVLVREPAMQEEITMTVTTPKTLPQANGDFYAIHSTLSEEDQALLRRPGLPGGRSCPCYYGVLDS
jgi:hypothetical protein